MTQMIGEFQETEIGSIPSDWGIVDLGDVYAIQQGKAVSQKHLSGPNLRPFLRTSNVYWGKLDLTTIDEMNFKPEEERKLRLQAGDLLICEGGDIGRTAIWNSEIQDCYYQNHVFRVRSASPNAHPLFHMYWMQAGLTILGCYSGHGNKTTIPNLSKRRLASFLIPLPPLDEQRRIAAVLTAMQDAIAAQEDVIAAARAFKRSLMHRLFTHGPGRVPAETKETEIGEIPVHWEVVELGELADIDYGIQAAVAHMIEESNGTPILTNINITLDGSIDLSTLRYFPISAKNEGKILHPGDVLFNWRSGSQRHVGKTAIFDKPGDYTFSSFILRFRPRQDVTSHFLAQYLHYLRTTGFFIKQRDQSSVNSVINASSAARLAVAYPKKPDEQKDIVSQIGGCDAKIAAEEDRKAALDALFKSMLHQLMTGQIRLLIDEGLSVV